MMTIDRGAESDLPSIVALFNHYIIHTPITFYVEPFTVEARAAWFEQFTDQGPHQILVAKDSGQLVGFAGSAGYRNQAAYDQTVEVFIYLAPEAGGKGLGTRLYTELFSRLKQANVHMALAGIALPNPASLAIHKKVGFVETGVLHEVGYKFSTYWDVAWLEKRI